MTSINRESGGSSIDISDEFLSNVVVHSNIGQEIIIVDANKIRLRLIEHARSLRGRTQWISPAGLLVTIGATLVAADFKSTLGMTADYWRAMFTLSAIASIVWLAIGIWGSIRSFREGNVDQLIERIRSDRASGGV